MNQNCVKCDITLLMMTRLVSSWLYRECVECSSVEPYSAHIVYPHKTGAFVQPVSSETKKSLDRLDRRAVKVGGKMSAPTNVKEWKMWNQNQTKPKPEDDKIYY